MVTDSTSQTDDTTAFLRAARSGNLEKVIEYLDTDLDINTANSNGLNALHLASKDGHVEIVTELLKRGAKVDAATKKGNTALHIASLAGQVEIVNILIQYGAAANIQSQNGFTPLYMAAQENHDQVVKLLLSNGANQSLATEDGFTPLAVAMQQGHEKVVSVLLENDSKGKVRLPALHIAAKKDDCKAADLLLQNDHKPDVTSKSGFTPLHIAAHYGNEEIARLLIKRGADVNYLAKHNISPLHVAAKWGKNNMVKILLENSAMIDAKTRDGLTPLHCAARSGHEEVVSTLLEHEAPISARTKNGLAPLHMASQGDHVDAARVLLYHRAPVDEVTIDYLTSLHVAAHCGHVRVAKLLLDRKADPNARALNGFTPLHIACKKNRIKVVELLLKHGASIESTTESGLTPLHVASFMGCMNIVIFLLQHEANPDVPTVRGETPLHLAARANQTDIIRILLRNGAKVDARAREEQTPLHIASRLGNVDIVMLLLQHGAAVDTTTKDMYTALHIAAKEGQEEVAAILVENHASVKAATKNGFTPLHIAAKYGNMNVAKILLQKDSKLDAQGKNDITPLHLACHYDHSNVANMILEKGASPHLASQNGHTPLHIAARKNQMDIASTLLEHGADPNVQSKAGFTPLQLSAQKGHYDMTNLLIEHGADPNHKAKNGLTALHLCAQEDFIRVASILVKNGANVESETETGYRPIHVAAHFGNLSMIRFLLKHNAQIDVRTNQNYTPLHQAAQQGHAHIVSALLEGNASHNARTTDGLTALNVAQKLGYISVMEVLKGLSYDTLTPDNRTWEEKYKVIAPESLQETSFMSDSDDEGGSDGLINEQPYRYLTADLMKSLRDDSLPIDVTRDDPIHRQVSKEEKQEFVQSNNYCLAENFDTNDSASLARLHFRSFLVSFLVDARGGAMKGCRHSGIRIIVPPRRATMPIRVTCRLIKPSKVANPPSLMEGEALATRIIEMGPVGASFLGPVLIDVPHFASVQGKEREIIILRSENGETWKEHDNSPDNDDTLFNTPHDTQMSASHSGRITRILTTEFPQYFAIVTRIKQEVHVIGADGGILISSVANHVQAVFPPGALTKKIKVGLQAHVIPAELTAKLLGNCVAVSPVITIEPRRRKFHKPITLTIPVPQAANKGMINHYGGETPTLRLLCSIAGGTSEAQWEDVTGSTPLTFMNDRVSFTTTVSARFWLMDCRNISEVPKMATELYKESLFVPFITNFVIYTKRLDVLEATLRILCMTDGKEGIHTLERQEEFMEIVKSRDVEALDGKDLYIEFSGNLVPVTKSGVQLKFTFKAFRQNRLSFHVKVRDPLLDPVARMMFMKDPKVAKGEPSQQPICILNIVLPDSTALSDSEKKIKEYEDTNLKGGKEDHIKSYTKLEGEKGDKPKPSSPSESKFITDILQKEQTDAATIHESFAQKAACPLESVDASYPSNVSVPDEQLSPEIEKQTYTEKRKFWEDITKKRENYQRSESELSRTSQLTVNESDSECCIQNIVSEEETAEAVPGRSETMEDLNIPDISECSVAEKAHYFEEQIQKELSTSRPTSKLITQESLKDKDLINKVSSKIASELSTEKPEKVEEDRRGDKQDWNLAESMKEGKMAIVSDEKLEKEKVSGVKEEKLMQQFSTLSDEKKSIIAEEKLSKEEMYGKSCEIMREEVISVISDEKLPEEKILTVIDDKSATKSDGSLSNKEEKKIIMSDEKLPKEKMSKEEISTSSDATLSKEEIPTISDEKLSNEEISTISDEKLPKEEISTISDAKLSKEGISITSEEKLSKKEISITSDGKSSKEEITITSDEKLSKEKISTISDEKLSKEQISTTSDEKLPKEQISTTSDEKLPKEQISTTSDEKLPKEQISRTSDEKLSKENISTTSDEILPQEVSTIDHHESLEVKKSELTTTEQTSDSQTEYTTKISEEVFVKMPKDAQNELKAELEMLQTKSEVTTEKLDKKLEEPEPSIAKKEPVLEEKKKKSEKSKIPSKIPEFKKPSPPEFDAHRKICNEFLHHETKFSHTELESIYAKNSHVSGKDLIQAEKMVVEAERHDNSLEKNQHSVKMSGIAASAILSPSEETTKALKEDSHPSMIPRKIKPEVSSKETKKVPSDETKVKQEAVESIVNLTTETSNEERDVTPFDKESTSPSEKETLKMQEEAKMMKKESRIPISAAKAEKEKTLQTKDDISSKSIVSPAEKSPTKIESRFYGEAGTSPKDSEVVSPKESKLMSPKEWKPISPKESKPISPKEPKPISPKEDVTSPKKEFESRIPKRSALPKATPEKKDAGKISESVTETKTTEKLSSQHYQKHTSEIKTKTVSKSFVGQTKDDASKFEEIEKGSSVVTSKTDHRASTEITEVSTSDPKKLPEKIVKHEESEHKQKEALSESNRMKATPQEILEETQSESLISQSSAAQEISMIFKDGKEAVDARASQLNKMEKEAKEMQSLTDELGTSIKAIDLSSIKEREMEAELKIEKEEPINLEDEMKNAAIKERQFEETLVTEVKSTFPTELTSEKSVSKIGEETFVSQPLDDQHEPIVKEAETGFPSEPEVQETILKIGEQSERTFVPQTLQEREEQMVKEVEARNIAETIIESIQTEIARRSASLEGIKQLDTSDSDSKEYSENTLDMDTRESAVFHDQIADDLTKKFEDMMERRSRSQSQVMDENEMLPERLRSVVASHDENIERISDRGSISISEDLTKDEESTPHDVMERRSRSQSQVMDENDMLPERLRSVVASHDENLERISDRGSISISEDLTKDEESTPHDKEESFPSSSEHHKLLDRDMTVSPSSISDHIDEEASIELERSVYVEPSRFTIARPSFHEFNPTQYFACLDADGELPEKGSLEIYEPEIDYESRQASIDLPSSDNDEPQDFGQQEFIDNSSPSFEPPSREPAEFSSIHESPAIESLDKICLDRDITVSPSTMSEDTNVDFSLVQDQVEKKMDGREKLANFTIGSLDGEEIEGPSVISPRLKPTELQIKPVNWMIGDEKIEVSEPLQPSQAFDKELEEYQTTIMRQNSRTLSREGSEDLEQETGTIIEKIQVSEPLRFSQGFDKDLEEYQTSIMTQKSQTLSREGSADFEQESGTRSSEDVSAIDSVKETFVRDSHVTPSTKPSKFTVVPVNEPDFESELVENRLDISCQELVDTLQREYEAKTPTDDRDFEGTRYTFDMEASELTDKVEKARKSTDFSVHTEPLLDSSGAADIGLGRTGDLSIEVPILAAHDKVKEAVKRAAVDGAVKIALEIAEAESERIEDSLIDSGDEFVVKESVEETSKLMDGSISEKRNESTSIVPEKFAVKVDVVDDASEMSNEAKKFKDTSEIIQEKLVTEAEVEKVVTKVPDEIKTEKVDDFSNIVTGDKIGTEEDAAKIVDTGKSEGLKDSATFISEKSVNEAETSKAASKSAEKTKSDKLEVSPGINSEKSETGVQVVKEVVKTTQDSKSEIKTKDLGHETKLVTESVKIVTKLDEAKTDVRLKGLKQTSPSKSKSSHEETKKQETEFHKPGDSSAFKLKKEDLQSVDLSARYAITVLDQVVNKEIAEVKESLEAAKQDLIEELSENSETVFQIKDSPSEFQFKLEPETIPNDLPFLYKASSIEQEAQPSAEGSPIAKPRKHADVKEDTKILLDTESKVAPTSRTSKDDEKSEKSVVHSEPSDLIAKTVQIETKESEKKTKITVQRDASGDASAEETWSQTTPVPASRTSSDAESKDETPSLLAPQPAPRRRQKPARAPRKVTSESDAGSSSGDSSNYQSCDYDIGSGSRPSSSDIEALQSTLPSGTVSEYESALMSIEHSSASRPTSQEYQSAVSTLSSRESMKSLNSLSSGHLGSIDSTGELSETLVASEAEEDDDKDQIDENLECILDDDHQAAKGSDSSSSEIPMEDAFDKTDDGLPCRMKRSSEMIFQQIIDEAAADETGMDEETGPEEETRFDECTTEQLPSDTVAEDEEAFRTDSIFMSTDLTSEAYDKSLSSMESKTDVPEGQIEGDIQSDMPLLDTHLEADEEADLSETKQTVESSVDETAALQTSMGTLLHQASTTSSTSGAMSFETVIEKEAKIDRHSPDSDSFELVDKPDIIDDFVVIEEVGREAEEFDSEGKSISIGALSYTSIKKYDRDLENLITENKEEKVSTSQVVARNNELFDFESEESPPMASNDDQYSQSLSDDENFEGSKKWMEMQFQNDPRGYDMEYDRGRLEDIKEEEITDFEAGSSRFGSLGSHKGSIGSVGSMRGSFGSTTEYDVLAGKKCFSKPAEHDNISLSSLQEFEHLESAVALENSKKLQCGSQDSVNNGSLPRRYIASRSGHGDDISLSSLKDFEGLEKACREAHLIELRAREEEDLLDHESPENRYKLENLPRPKPTEPVSAAGSFNPSTSGSDDYEKRIMEIDEIIRIAQANVEKFDRQDDTTEDISQIEITAEAEKIEPVAVAPALPTESEDAQQPLRDTNVMETSTDSLELEENTDKKYNPLCRSSDSLEMKTTIDFPSLSSDSLNNVRDPRETPADTTTDLFNSGRRISSDSLEMPLVEQQDPDSHDKSSGSHGSYHVKGSFDDSVEHTSTDTKITNNGKTRSPSTSDT